MPGQLSELVEGLESGIHSLCSAGASPLGAQGTNSVLFPLCLFAHTIKMPWFPYPVCRHRLKLVLSQPRTQNILSS